ncbi:ser thr protein phosphatase family [Diplodia corticola]|uniref:Ser thr protein phosphatase family n=1 Tax=Diplodia corticola TaxID=236234 RepID=A0A1J9QJY4_9PEZI|nr:ser thr protein phosphatase family [Diplodia corticola]OJD28785.1 ser thr protein phosphatase family [Diplodia corticola]
MIPRSFLPLVFAAGAYAAQPSAPSPKAAPLRELPWAQLNFLHTTDTHGWHGGHLQESSYSADWGDYISFAKHMRARADADGVDLLLIDTGDRVEGNGLYDASEPKGKYTFDIFKHQHIDVICSGNHELYKQNSSENEFYYTVPNFNGSYLASNLDIVNPESGELEPLAPRFKKFTTKNQGIRVLSFGFLFNFAGNANNTVVKPVEDTVKEQWFQDAIRDKDVDLILVIGHVALRTPEYKHIFKAIRSVQWDVPIQFFGGHAHVRDFKRFDDRSVAIASGRYMETVGFLSIDGLSTGKSKSIAPQRAELTFGRRYIDNNLFSLYHHSGKNESTFSTPEGKDVTKMIAKAREELRLDKKHGCAPQNLWVNRAPFPATDSIFTWLQEHVLPEQMSNTSRVADNKKALVITNTGAMRFDIFKGPFTKDSTFLVSPFTSGFHYIKDVPYAEAQKVLRVLNKDGVQTFSEGPLDSAVLAPPEQQSGRLSVASTRGLGSEYVANDRVQAPLTQDQPSDLTPGYTTIDDAGSEGDDTVHSAIQFFEVPNCIQAELGFSSKDEEPEEVDLVFNEFLQPWILVALRYLGQEYDVSDAQPYMEGRSFTSIITDWSGFPAEKPRAGGRSFLSRSSDDAPLVAGAHDVTVGQPELIKVEEGWKVASLNNRIQQASQSSQTTREPPISEQNPLTDLKLYAQSFTSTLFSTRGCPSQGPNPRVLHRLHTIVCTYDSPLMQLLNSLNTHSITMSAPNAGRQSPDPEHQTDAQQKGPQAAPHLGSGPDEGSKQASEQDKSALSSNPTHILEKHAEETTSKK